MQAETRRSSASRLLALVEHATQASGGTAVFDVLASTFGVEPSDRSAVYRGLASLHVLIAESSEAVSAQAQLKPSLYQSALSNIEAIVASLNLGASWDPYRTQLLGANLLGLQFVADQLDRLSTEIEIPAADLDSLRTLLDGAVTKVAAAAIDQELQRVLVEKLEAARQAILDYRFGGIGGIRKAAESGVGAVVLAGPAAKEESARETVGVYLDLFSKVVDLVNKATPVAKLLRPAMKFLIGSASDQSIEQ